MAFKKDQSPKWKGWLIIDGATSLAVFSTFREIYSWLVDLSYIEEGSLDLFLD